MVQSVEELRDRFHSNWLREEGPCSSCDLCAKARPQGGAINFDADVALVNNTPALGDEEKSGDNRERLQLDSKDGSEPSTPKKDYDVPEGTERPYTYKATEFKLDEEDQYSDDPWDFLEDIDRFLFEESYNGIELQLALEEVYYTNSLKCPKTGDFIKDGNGRSRCSEYLREELLEAVDVDIIITGGPEATRTVFYALDIDAEVPNGAYYPLLDSPEEFGGDGDLKHAAYGDDPVVIPTYQFGRIFQNWYHLDWINDDKNNRERGDYFKELIKRINHHL